jgi:multiple sugar transport system permease protein
VWTPFIYIVLVIFGATTLFPFLWVVGAAFKPTDEIIARPLHLFPNPMRWRLSRTLKASEVKDWQSFCATFSAGGLTEDPTPGARFHAMLPEGVQQLVAECGGGTALTPAEERGLLAALNGILADPTLYEKESFLALALPVEATDLIHRLERGDLGRGGIVRLNRTLLETSFPRTIEPAIGPFDNFRRAMLLVPFARFFLNSLLVAAVVTLGQVTTSACAAYAFARLRWPGRDRVFLGYLATMMVPWTVVMIPTFVMLKAFGWIDTYWALTIPAMFSAYGTFMLRQFFLGIPKEYEEAAKIDGCGYLGIFLHVILPLSKPALATLGLFTFIGSWNNLIAPLVFITSEEKMTLPLGLTRFQGLRDTDWGALMAGSLMMLVPMLILFAIGQRFFTRGIRLTTAKG